MDISKEEYKKINDLFNGEKGVHFSKAFTLFKPPYKTTALNWYKNEQEKKYGV